MRVDGDPSSQPEDNSITGVTVPQQDREPLCAMLEEDGDAGGADVAVNAPGWAEIHYWGPCCFISPSSPL